MSNALPNEEGRTFALDGYRIPNRICVYFLDSLYGEGVDEHKLLVGIDSISKKDTCTGGTVEPGEKLLRAALGEDREEAGPDRDPIPVHSRIITFPTCEKTGQVVKAADREIDLNEPIALRNYIRTKSTVLPVQQPARHGELYPEVIRPCYRMMLPMDLPHMLVRPSFAHAIEMAQELKMLYTVLGRKEVSLDYEQLAREWEAERIHPEIIKYYCKPRPWYESIISWQEKLNLLPSSLSALMGNLDAADKKLHDMLNIPDAKTEKLLEELNS